MSIMCLIHTQKTKTKTKLTNNKGNFIPYYLSPLKTPSKNSGNIVALPYSCESIHNLPQLLVVS